MSDVRVRYNIKSKNDLTPRLFYYLSSYEWIVYGVIKHTVGPRLPKTALNFDMISKFVTEILPPAGEVLDDEIEQTTYSYSMTEKFVFSLQ